VLWAREHTPIPSPSDVFFFGLAAESIKELGGVLLGPNNTKDESSLLCIVKFIVGNSNSNTHLKKGRRDAQLT
jgi:hypothetical protein